MFDICGRKFAFKLLMYKILKEKTIGKIILLRHLLTLTLVEICHK